MRSGRFVLIFTTLAFSSTVISANTIQCHDCIYWEGIDPSKGSQPSCATSWPGENLITCTSGNSVSKSDAEIQPMDENTEDDDAEETDEFYCFNLKTILDSKEVVLRGCAQYSGVEKLQGYCEYSTISHQTTLGAITRGAPMCYCNDDDGCTFFNDEEFGDGPESPDKDHRIIHSELGF